VSEAERRENQLFVPAILFSTQAMNATDRKRKKMQAGGNDSDGEIAKLTRVYDWRTTDQDEIRLRQQRAREEQPQIRNLEPTHRIFSQFEVRSPSGMTYLEYFEADELLRSGLDVEEVVANLRQLGIFELRISQEVPRWIEQKRRRAERIVLRRDYEEKVQSGIYPQHETRVPLFPYQREGMLHLAFNERALLADEMGLGKTIQAIAACALLYRLGKAVRVLVVTPASLKTEWEEQIQQFSELSYRLVFGPHRERLRPFQEPAVFYYRELRTNGARRA
jgi:SNF2 family DNA or RNA helicase